jgi:hypothetical protein
VTVLDHLSEPVKHLGDVVAGATLLATLLSWMPAIGSVLAVVWVAMRIFESWQNIRLNDRKLRGRE